HKSSLPVLLVEVRRRLGQCPRDLTGVSATRRAGGMHEAVKEIDLVAVLLPNVRLPRLVRHAEVQQVLAARNNHADDSAASLLRVGIGNSGVDAQPFCDIAEKFVLAIAARLAGCAISVSAHLLVSAHLRLCHKFLPYSE